MILHIPHSSTKLKHLTSYKSIYQKGIDRMTDHFTDDLFDHPCSQKIIFPFSRLWCDVERYRDDSKEEMSKIGQGVFYTEIFDTKLRNKTQKIQEEVYRDYDKHHKILNEAVSNHLKTNLSVVVVDCHSFHSDKGPDFCIGTNEKTPEILSHDIMDYIKSKNYEVELNYPYAGCMVPSDYQYNGNIHAIMIEVNRELYQEDNLKKSKDYERIQNIINKILSIISKYEKESNAI